MALNFPNSPTTGEIYLAQNGINYQWDGEKWVVYGSDFGAYLRKDASAGQQTVETSSRTTFNGPLTTGHVTLPGGGGPTGVVTNVAITDGGTGYLAGANGVNPVGGSGSGLSVDYATDGDVINSITLVAGGQDYIDGETVTINDGNSDAVITLTVA